MESGISSRKSITAYSTRPHLACLSSILSDCDVSLVGSGFGVFRQFAQGREWLYNNSCPRVFSISMEEYPRNETQTVFNRRARRNGLRRRGRRADAAGEGDLAQCDAREAPPVARHVGAEEGHRH